MSVTVEIGSGRLRGVDAGGVLVFRGIPYARADRFGAPEPADPWLGVRDATIPGPVALQNTGMLGPMLGMDLGRADESCHYLNVWTPATDAAKRPVMVWIHGGAFVIGAGSQPLYDAGQLARRGDVVVVTLNYRLGALGFLHLPEMGASGNLGILDQVAALEWVRDQIERFGGDPNDVTIFGESAGSMSCATLLGVPRARGLFRRAILQSGAANFTLSRDRADDVATAFLQALDLPRSEAKRLLDVPPARLLAAQEKVAAARTGGGRLALPFAPVVDGAVLPRHPLAAVADGEVRDVAVLIGTTLEEIKLFSIMDGKARTLDEEALLRRCERVMPVADGERAATARRAVDVYRRAREGRGERSTPPALWCAIESDRVFRYPAMRLAELQRAHQPRVHAYLFTWRSPLLDGALGACHALDLPFVFGTLVDPRLVMFAGSGPEADALSTRMQDAWLAFARHGTPGADWPAYDTARRATMMFGTECGVADAPYEPERAFWSFWDGA